MTNQEIGDLVDAKLADIKKELYQKVEGSYKNCMSQILDIRAYREPQNWDAKLRELEGRVHSIHTNILIIKNKLESIKFDEKFLELFSDDELQNLYSQSGFSLNDVKEFLEKYILIGQQISLPTASNYVTGTIKDLKNRNIIGKFLREGAIRANNNVKNN